MEPEEKLDIFDKFIALPCLRKLMPLWHKYRSAIVYLFFGGLTTVISIGSFSLCYYVFTTNELLSNIISWLCAVAFAFVTNRKWVFQSTATGKEIIKEAFSFFCARLTTFFTEEMIILIFITILGFDALLIKLIAQIVILISNYFLSRFLVFKK